MMSDFLAWMSRVPDLVVYLALGLGAALENVVPAIPADTFVALGGFLSEVGRLKAGWVFGATWICNVASSLITYRLGYRHGTAFFSRGWGRKLLRPQQMEHMKVFYARWGTFAIFFTRFLPGLRAVVPVFAGVSLAGWLPVAIPLALASAIWYGGLVWLGAFAGRNLDRLGWLLDRLNGVLGVAALIVAAAVLAWWWRSRRARDE